MRLQAGVELHSLYYSVGIVCGNLVCAVSEYVYMHTNLKLSFQIW